ncbi:MAG: hypothetical protein JO077_07285 [Verrucomicrobia bacterium]|nr:hypothetical protein [Verrucomicrobiota bacterium]
MQFPDLPYPELLPTDSTSSRRLLPALQTLLDAAAAAGEVRSGVKPDDLLHTVPSLCAPVHDGDPARARRMLALLVDGLRYGAKP